MVFPGSREMLILGQLKLWLRDTSCSFLGKFYVTVEIKFLEKWKSLNLRRLFRDTLMGIVGICGRNEQKFGEKKPFYNLYGLFIFYKPKIVGFALKRFKSLDV